MRGKDRGSGGRQGVNHRRESAGSEGWQVETRLNPRESGHPSQKHRREVACEVRDQPLPF